MIVEGMMILVPVLMKTSQKYELNNKRKSQLGPRVIY
jgi:hypothetical protein